MTEPPAGKTELTVAVTCPGWGAAGDFIRSRTFSYKMHSRRGIGVERADLNGMPPCKHLVISSREYPISSV